MSTTLATVTARQKDSATSSAVPRLDPVLEHENAERDVGSVLWFGRDNEGGGATSVIGPDCRAVPVSVRPTVSTAIPVYHSRERMSRSKGVSAPSTTAARCCRIQPLPMAADPSRLSA